MLNFATWRKKVSVVLAGTINIYRNFPILLSSSKLNACDSVFSCICMAVCNLEVCTCFRFLSQRFPYCTKHQPSIRGRCQFALCRLSLPFELFVKLNTTLSWYKLLSVRLSLIGPFYKLFFMGRFFIRTRWALLACPLETRAMYREVHMECHWRRNPSPSPSLLILPLS
jgi:hypothetical protein